MKCSNCGAELKEGDLFCSVCGQKADGSDTQQGQGNPAQETQEMWQNPENTPQTEALGQPGADGWQAGASGQNGQPGADGWQAGASGQNGQPGADGWQAGTFGQNIQQSGEPGKKKSKKTLAAVVAAVIVVCIIGVAAFAFPAIKKAMMSPLEYYQYVEKKNRDEKADFFIDYYAAAKKSLPEEETSKEISMKVNLSDTLKSLLGAYGVDMSKVKEISMDVLYGARDSKAGYELVASINGERLISGSIYNDYENKELYCRAPELSKAYMDLSSVYQDEEVQEIFSKLSGLSFLPTENALQEMIQKYTDLVIDNVKQVEKSDGTCEAGGVSVETKNYTVTISQKEFTEIGKKVLTALRDDKDIKAIADHFSDTAWQSWQDEIDDMLEECEEDGEGTDTAKMTVEVADDDTIVGRIIEVDGAKIVMASPSEGDDFGYELTMSDTENKCDMISLVGSGTNRSGVLNGDFTLKLDQSLAGDSIANPDKVLMVECKDYDLNHLKDGYVNGMLIYSSEAVAELANYKIQIEAEGDKDGQKEKCSLLAGSDELVSLDALVKESDRTPDEFKPSDGDQVYDEQNSEEYVNSIDYSGVIDNLSKNLGIDEETLGKTFSALISGAGSSQDTFGSYEDYDLNDYDMSDYD